MLNSGTKLSDRYEILAPLGAGGMGVVYRARDLRLDREVAVKILPNHLAKDQDAMSRFQREAKALASLSHTGILSIYDFDSDQDVNFAVMELLKGETLRSCLLRKKLHWKESVQIALAIAKGLEAAHSQHVIHRDLKPENIFLTLNDGVKILDFGLARVVRDDQSAVIETKEGVVLGTFPYMSPEQIRGKRVDTRSDIFSFGSILFEMLTASPAFFGAGQAEITASILKEDPISREPWPDDIPHYVKTAVKLCLEKSPETRFQNIGEAASALRGSRIAMIQARLRNAFGAKPFVAFFALLSMLLIGFAIYPFVFKGSEVQSIAVLPFENSSQDENAEYLSDGITETLIGNLSRIPNLRVMAHDTVFSYKGKSIDPRKVGNDLKVEAVLTGRVTQHGNTLTIYTNLLKVADGTELWGEVYNRSLSDLPNMQSDLSRDISSRLRARLEGKQQDQIAKQKTQNSEAYQLYLKGEYLFYKFDPENFVRAKNYFEQAVQKDPKFADAWAGIGDCYGGLTFGGYIPATELSKGRVAAARALQLDSSNPHTHLTIGRLHFLEWDWQNGEKELQTAIQMNPYDPELHRTYSEMLRSVGKWDAAISEANQAHELDPLSVVHTETLGITYFWAQKYDLAIEQYRKALELEERAATHDALSDVYARKRMYKEAIEEKQRSLTLSGDSDSAIELGRNFQQFGYQEATNVLTRNYLEAYQSAAERQYISPLIFAVLYAELNQKDEAFEWLDKSYQEHSVWLVNLKTDPQFDSLRSDVRFQNLIKKVGIPN
jgi:eukaryotic-like serine/threonine-protein kinase